MDLELSGKRALITGGSRGIGKAIAIALANEGVDIAIAARDEERLKLTAEEIASITGRDVITAVFDAADDDSVDEMIADVRRGLGDVDILVNSAASPGGGNYAWNELQAPPLLNDLNIKAVGALRCAQRVIPQMIEHRWGRIINIGGHMVRQSRSILGTMRNASIAGITKHLADELGQYGINVHVVHPGFTRTERTPGNMGRSNSLERLIDASEVAAVVAFLASPRSVAITGEAIHVGGGMKGPIYY
jgi:NAD(P)-dependent dehydrogenase (short-subunit alcohol dehydrogenase family)